MRSFHCLLLAIAAFPSAIPAQVANVSGNGLSPVFDPRPFGKYLVQICTLSTTTPFTVSCDAPPAPARDSLPPPPISIPVTPLTAKGLAAVTMKLAGCLPSVTPCPAPSYPLSEGATFYVNATSDSDRKSTRLNSS